MFFPSPNSTGAAVRAMPLKKAPRHCGQWAGSESADGATSAIVVSNISNRNPATAPDLFIISFTSGFCAKALRVESLAASIYFYLFRCELRCVEYECIKGVRHFPRRE